MTYQGIPATGIIGRTVSETKNQAKFLDPTPQGAIRQALIPNSLSSGLIFDGAPNVLLDPSYYQPDPDGYLSDGLPNGGAPQKSSPVKPYFLEWPEKGDFSPVQPKISNSLASLYGSVRDFKTFGLYIHHNIGAAIPANLWNFNQQQLSTFLKRRQFILNGTINVFPTLQSFKQNEMFNFYNRSNRLRTGIAN